MTLQERSQSEKQEIFVNNLWGPVISRCAELLTTRLPKYVRTAKSFPSASYKVRTTC